MFAHKLAVFDVDGTLTESKSPMTEEMGELINKLSSVTMVAFISGFSLSRFQKQVLPFIKPSKNIILLPTDGSMCFQYDEDKKDWIMTDREPFPEKIKSEVMRELTKIIASRHFDIPQNPYGDYIEDRDTQINFSALGQNAPLEAKKLWDPHEQKRKKIKEQLESVVEGITASVAGTTSIDVLPKGFDKAFGLNLFLKKSGISPKDVIFVGDAVFPGGNDYSVLEAGIETLKTDGPSRTAGIIRQWLIGKEGDSVLPKNPIAFFCTEYALEDDHHMYAGGLGILAGDYLMEMADRDTPLIAFGLNYDPDKLKDFVLYHHQGKPLLVSIPVSNHILYAQVWHRILADNVHILLLDTKVSENNEDRQKITSILYDPHFYNRVQQQILLGLGGMRILQILDINPSIYHLNEGHTAFGGVAVMVERKDDLSKIVATKHTILSEAGLHIPRKDFSVLLGAYCKQYGVDVEEVFKKGEYELDPDIFSTTKFLMNISQRKNSVSALHAVFEKKRHSHSQLIPITNGVYRRRWQAKEFTIRDQDISDEDIWKIKRNLRSSLFNYIHEKLGKELDPDICTVVWARRFAAYKRPFLLFSDYDRIVKILSNQEHPVQFVISGKAHDADEEGKEIVRKITALSEDPATHERVVYIPNYSLDIARELVRGADIWLNTPERGKEACGTSGMKAALNGSLQCSVSDGWVDEVNWGGRGWILPEDNTAHVLYDLLEHEILPGFYEVSDEGIPHQWIKKMRSTIELVEKSYTTEHMSNLYMKELYLLSS